MIRVALSVVLREWRVQRRYPVTMVNLVLLTPLYQLALPTLLLGSAFLVDGASVGLRREAGTADLAGWIGFGVLSAALLVGTVTSVYGTLEADRQTGVIEHSWASPAPRESYVVGAVLTGSLFAGAASVILIGFAVAFLHASFSLTGLLLAVPAIAAMVVANCGVGYLTAAAVLALRQADALTDVATMLAVLFSGVSFPLTLLPGATRWPTYALPDTWALDLVRGLALHTDPLAPRPVEAVAAVAVAVFWLVVGRRTFQRTERHLAAAGTLAQF